MEFCRASAWDISSSQYWEKGRGRCRGETWPFVLHIWSLLTAGRLRTSNATTERTPASPSLSLPASPELQSCTAVLDDFFISYSSLPSIRSPLTNQAALWGRTPAAFNKVWLPYTQVHTAVLDVACHSTAQRGSVSPHLGTFMRCPLRKIKVFGDEDRTSLMWRR